MIAAYSMAPSKFSYSERRAYELVTRVTDVAIASAMLLAVGPVLGVAAIAIKLEDRGPILFKQRRVGRFGRLFDVYKLRTMRVDKCGDAPSPTSKRDPRITGVGAFLRKTSIDELPQLVNVLNGTMALVGPRPEQPFHVRNYEPWQNLRLFAKPGITCFWQIRCRSRVPLNKPEATVHDLEYIGKASPITDGKILFKTIGAVFSSQGAY